MRWTQLCLTHLIHVLSTFLNHFRQLYDVGKLKSFQEVGKEDRQWYLDAIRSSNKDQGPSLKTRTYAFAAALALELVVHAARHLLADVLPLVLAVGAVVVGVAHPRLPDAVAVRAPVDNSM